MAEWTVNDRAGFRPGYILLSNRPGNPILRRTFRPAVAPAGHAMLPFALTIFTGAFLLFLVQPLIGKYILPWFGGTPGVWTTCMLFFQLVLLAGYAYAHFTSRWLRPRQQAIVHLVLLGAAVAVLPIIPADAWKPQAAESPIGYILLLLGACIGLPYFVLSTTGPLMQAWFARLNPGRSPYRLYALSNIGSLLALLGFPFLFEPVLARQAQAQYWGWGLVAYALSAAWCVRLFWKKGLADEIPVDGAALVEEEPVPAPSFRQKALWLALPACASALLLATTNKLCQDVAVIPFLWVLPLSLYLLTFILCFDARAWYWRPLFLPAMLGCFGWLVYVLKNINDIGIGHQVAAFCLTLFVACMVCHGELYALKPHPRHLTGFYLMISLGGAVGGFLVAVVAPHVFATYAELAWSCSLCALLGWFVCLPNWRVPNFAWWRFNTWLAGSLPALGIGVAFYMQSNERENLIEATRNFYGAMSVIAYGDDTPGSRYLLLQHGRITHGFQFTDPDQRRRLTTYYGQKSGVGLAILNSPRKEKRIGVVGLGTGTLAAYGQKGDYVRIYEINSEVKRLATSRFTFVNDAITNGAKVDIILGDARLSMEREEPQHLDVLALDAFSSDAIPIHLLTKEAMQNYQKHLAPDGVLAVHISNRYLDLEPVVENLAKEFGYASVTVEDSESDDEWWIYTSTWVLLSKSTPLIDALRDLSKTDPEKKKATVVPLWTDDYASLLPIMSW